MLAQSAAAGQASSATFTAAFQPQAAVRGGVAVESFTLTNTSTSSSNRLGSADVTIPAGFIVSSSRFDRSPARGRDEGHPGNKDWRATIGGGVIHLRAHANGKSENDNDTLKAGQWVRFTFWIVTPCSAGDSSSWPTVGGSSTTSPSGDFTLASVPTLGAARNCSFALHVSDPQHAGNPINSLVVAVDGYGFPMLGYDGSASVSGTLDPSPGGTTPVYDTLAFHHGFAIGQPLATPYAAETGRTLTVSAPGMTGTSNLFDVVGDASSAELQFVQQPTDTSPGTSIAPAISVDSTDQYGNPLPNNGSVALALGNDGAGGGTNLGGTLTQAVSGGLATFPDITLDQGGTGFTLVASEAGYASATSDPFDVISNCPAGETCQSDGQGTSVIGPQGSDISFGPPNQPLPGCSDGNSIGSIANITPPDGSEGTLTYEMRYSTSILPLNSDGRPTPPRVFCMSKDGGETYFQLQTCTSDGEFSVGPPCVASQGFGGGSDIEVAFVPTYYYFVIEIPADDPRCGGGP